MPKFKYTPKQWYAIKAKLQKEGKWDERRGLKRGAREPLPDPKPPVQYVDEPTTEEINAFLDDLQNNPGEFDSEFMPNVNSDLDLSIGSSTTSGNSKSREISKTNSNIHKVHLEMSGSNSEQVSNSNIPVFYQRGNSPSEARENGSSPESNPFGSRAGYSGRADGISKYKSLIRNECIIMNNKGMYMSLNEFNFDSLESLNLLEDYFQSYNSIGIVIKALPGIHVSSTKMFRILYGAISDPFVIISERSKEGVLHWHMIWLTCKRTDNAKRILQSKLSILSDKFSIACQQTKSFKNLLRYILKEPITVGVANSDQLTDYCVHILKDEPYKKQDTTSNPMVTDILNAMKSNRIYNYEELLKECPDIMIKYLHKPNLESIISNCKMFLLKPGNTKLIMERVVGQQDIQPFFKIWAFLAYQGIEPGDFLLDFYNVLFKLTDKHNVICLQGGSNAGKTTFIRPLLEIFNFGEIVSGGQFMFQNCINKELLIWEEPLIGHDYVEMCKRVFEGMSTQVPVKYRAPQTLHRTPILITTNKDVWHYSSADEEALRNRMLHYEFNEPAELYRDRNCGWWKRTWRAYCEWITKACRYVESSDQNCADGVECLEPEGSQQYGWQRQCIHTDSEPGCPVCEYQHKHTTEPSRISG